jgi:hypothetical protein
MPLKLSNFHPVQSVLKNEAPTMESRLVTQNVTYLVLPAALGPGVHSASNRNEYQTQKNNVCGSRARQVRWADNLTAICEPIV